MSEKLWINQPTILLNKNEITQLWPLESMDSVDKINAITRLIFILTFLGYLVSRSFKIIVTGVVTLGVLVFLHYSRNRSVNLPSIKKMSTEGFTNPNMYEAVKSSLTQPTEQNPLMNVALPELNGNPKRKPAAPSFNQAVEEDINEKTKQQIINNNGGNENLFKNLGDNVIFKHSMRNFYSTANTRIPNDQTAFAEFCYGDMPSCKEGNSFACEKNNFRHINM